MNITGVDWWCKKCTRAVNGFPAASVSSLPLNRTGRMFLNKFLGLLLPFKRSEKLTSLSSLFKPSKCQAVKGWRGWHIWATRYSRESANMCNNGAWLCGELWIINVDSEKQKKKVSVLALDQYLLWLRCASFYELNILSQRLQINGAPYWPHISIIMRIVYIKPIYINILYIQTNKNTVLFPSTWRKMSMWLSICVCVKKNCAFFKFRCLNHVP